VPRLKLNDNVINTYHYGLPVCQLALVLIAKVSSAEPTKLQGMCKKLIQGQDY